MVGAQFGDPSLFRRWLQESFEVSSRHVSVGEHDRVHEVLVAGPSPIRVDVAMPAHWAPEAVYEHIFRDPPDAVLLVLTAMERVAHTNAMALGWARPHLSRLGLTPQVLVNNPHGPDSGFPLLDAARVCSDHHVPWPARESMIGNFIAPKLRWTEGAEEIWNLLLDAAKRRRTSAPQ